MKDKIEWFGKSGKAGVDVIKTSGKAVGTVVSLAVVGATLGVVGKLFNK